MRRAFLALFVLSFGALWATDTSAFELLTNDSGRAISWRKFPQDVLVYGDTSDGLDSTAAQELVSRAFRDWADEGCFMTTANVASTPGVNWASGNGQNEVVWITGDTANYDPYRPTLGSKNAGDPCNADAECSTGLCEGTCVTPGPKAVGEVCGDDPECRSYVCASGMCQPRSIVLGITILVYPLQAEPYSILEADIVLNETDGGLDYAAGATNNTEPYSVVAHEVGHFLGLAHEPTLGVENALMHPAPKATMIQSDDRDGLCTQYPPGQPLCDSECDCFRGQFCTGYTPENEGVPGAMNCPRAELCIEGMCEEVLAAARGEACALDAENACEGEGLCEGDRDTSRVCDGEGSRYFRDGRGTCGGPCSGEDDCPPNGRCVDGSCDYPKTGQPGDPCEEDFDCENQQCNNNICGEPCNEDCDCSTLGERCDPEFNVCVKGRTSCYRDAQGRDLLDRRFTGNACSLHGQGASSWFALLGFLLTGSILTRLRLRTRHR